MRSILVRSRLLPAVVAVLACVLGAGLLAARASAHTYRYTVESRGDVSSSVARFREIADATLFDIRGWTLNHNVRYVRVSSGSDFRLILASPAAVDAASPGCSPDWSCRVGNQVLINDDNWRNATAAWPLSLRAYRSYVINHELGHWLGLGHLSCPRRGAAAPVMMQQSISLDGCKANVWPKPWERKRVAQIRDVDGWPVPPPDAPCSMRGTDGDDRIVGTRNADVICGRGGNDELRGRGGFDVLRGGPGADRLASGRGADIVLGGGGNDTIVGWPGGDELYGEDGDDRIRGKGGGDLLVGGSGADGLFAGRGDDRVRGKRGADTMIGWAGHDRLYGGRDGDRIWGRGGNDTIVGWAGGDELHGEDGDDALDGKGGHDLCRGGPGDDTLRNCEGEAG